jgi:hypothetical protein
MPDLAILYEHPKWFEPLFAALDRRGISYDAIRLSDHSYDPAARDVPAPVILSRVAMSSFLRRSDHGIFYAEALLAHWAARGATGAGTGPTVLALDFVQGAAAFADYRLCYAIPETRGSCTAPTISCRARAAWAWPLLGQGQYRRLGRGHRPAMPARMSLPPPCRDGTGAGQLRQGAAAPGIMRPARGGVITRIETLGARVPLRDRGEAAADSFDLCPADACVAAPGRTAIRMAAVTPARRSSRRRSGSQARSA